MNTTENPIRKWRKENKLSIFKAALQLGVSKNTLIWWESDSVIPNRYHRENIAKVLHLSEKDMKDWIWRIQK